jgi:hypothetical protein
LKNKGVIMGYYVQGPAIGKAQFIVSEHDGVIISQPKEFNDVVNDKAIICVVGNGAWEAAAYCYNEKEFEEFADPSDPRPKKWLVMDKDLAEELSGFKS